jgi:hypothetical protein
LQRPWRLLGCFVVVDALITIFGVTTGPLLLSLAMDDAVGLLIFRTHMELRAAIVVAPAGRNVLRFLSSPAVAKHRSCNGGW